MAGRLTDHDYEELSNEPLFSKMVKQLKEYEIVLKNPDGTPRVTMERLAELVGAEVEGRIAVLPCKVGDVVYSIFKGFVMQYEVTDIKMQNGGKYSKSIIEFWCDGINNEYDNVGFNGDEIGRNVFLTEPEAQAALERRDEPSNWMDNKKCYDAVIKTFGKDE